MSEPWAERPPEDLRLQALSALLSEAEAALSQVKIVLDQHSRASKARALAAIKAAQQEVATLAAANENWRQ